MQCENKKGPGTEAANNKRDTNSEMATRAKFAQKCSKQPPRASPLSCPALAEWLPVAFVAAGHRGVGVEEVTIRLIGCPIFLRCTNHSAGGAELTGPRQLKQNGLMTAQKLPSVWCCWKLSIVWHCKGRSRSVWIPDGVIDSLQSDNKVQCSHVFWDLSRKH